MPFEQPDYNAFTGDAVLSRALEREGAGWARERAAQLGAAIGSFELRELARQANQYLPELRTHDRFGNRIDTVDFHPSYHQLMSKAYASEVHSLAWTATEERSQVARGALSYLWNQGENGICCPTVMSYAIIPLLRSDAELGARWENLVLSNDYDNRHIPFAQKRGITVAMGMTEKQGGSDLRANETEAIPTGADREYILRGHKFFCSAPMGDLYLVTARTAEGISLFIAPRILPDGQRNAIRIERLKDKLGSRSNASSEIELDGALAYRIGEPGRGIRQFIKNMTHYIRMDLSIASAAIMRQSLTLAMHHTSNRSAFGSTISSLPQMQNTLADLAIESEAALLLGMRLARAADDEHLSDHDRLLIRVAVPVAKYWNCKRVNHVALEALECHGGMGYVEEQSIARLYREAPLNGIWEGSSAMMGLDLMRALRGDNATREALMDEINLAKGAHRKFDAYVAKLDRALMDVSDNFEPHARRVMAMIAMALQGSLLLRFSTEDVADAFVNSRLGTDYGSEFGTLTASPNALKRIIERASISG
ncbi:acyl-CoA dehydrogenase family protein [Noviherbaspirillum sp.]|uniref:acyl-CoA dehydrogenase family protein n=1 Tax=Noviherbaspirillum sp. TaxID=1926288 RepID=UPI002D4F67F2|nr:acyl-CoA dehydrogenase family protein [Noviherbaspirillum sp.]HZW22967.1 acyl-CoA dehydrogenase family protein [Noviherbaspirillum sp.]